MFRSRYNIFVILNDPRENIPGAHLEWRYFVDGQFAKLIGWVQTWLSLKAASVLMFKPRV